MLKENDDCGVWISYSSDLRLRMRKSDHNMRLK